jgi:hypothetical protein
MATRQALSPWLLAALGRSFQFLLSAHMDGDEVFVVLAGGRRYLCDEVADRFALDRTMTCSRRWHEHK